jgi:NAD(P)-dependent dehydrogenase (short-subunit alcohol dehydrogenase family)
VVMSRTPLVLVTGAAHGIGREIAVEAARAGYRVVVADVDDVGGRSTVDAITASGRTAFHTHVDMADPDQVRSLISNTVAEHGKLGVLVNNAAITQGLSFFDIGVDDWDRFFAVNARGCFFAMQYAARAMRESGGGAIVNIASIAGKGWSGTSNVAYASSKGAVVAMTRVAASQLGPFGVRVNAVCPGVTDTALLQRVLESRAGSVAEQRELLEGMSSLRRLNSPADIAAAVLFLASPGAQGITGQSLNVDAGILWD